MISTGRLVRLCRLAFIFAAAAVLFGCSGGGGGESGGGAPSGPSFQVSPTALNFSALANSAAPLPQAVAVSTSGISSGTLYFKVTIPSVVSSISSVSFTGPSTGQAFVNVGVPSGLGPGTHTGTISIVACTTDLNCSGPLLSGSPQTIAVTYTVTPTLQGDAVAPHVVSANVSGEVVIRGQGLSSTNSVVFGSSSATSITNVSATEIRATYPALIAGTYPVQLQNSSGPISFTGSLVAVDPVGYAPMTLGYPASPGNFRSVIYDAMRQAIVVATDTQLLRYAFAGSAWQAPAQSAIADLRDISLSIDGASLLALTSNSLRQLDPVTLAQNAITNGPVSGPSSVPLSRLALANDGIAVVTAEESDVYIYPTRNPAFFRAAIGGATFSFGALPAASDNGSLIAFIQGPLSPAPEVLKYAGSSGLLSAASVHLNRVSVNLLDIDPAPSVDRSGTRIAFNSSAGEFTGINVFADNLNLLGALPGTTAAVAFAPNPAGSATRAYTLDACTLRAFNLTLPLDSGNFVEILTTPYPIMLAGCPGNHPKMLVTPDGSTAILAGDQQIVIVPTP